MWKRLLVPMASTIPSIAEAPPAPPSVRKYDKITYHCACGSKVWVKAGLDLYCGNCNGPFTVAT